MPVIPMFPLGSVLFPAMPLALRVFEERYLKMMGALLDAEEPIFGVVLIERGSEVGGADRGCGALDSLFLPGDSCRNLGHHCRPVGKAGTQK